MTHRYQKIAVARLSIISNTVLMILKFITGLVIGSVSIMSEAIHSGVDLVASMIAYMAVKKSGEPADKNHPFGHGKIENISGTIEAILILIAAGWIIYEAIDKLIHPRPIAFLGWGIGVMLLSSVVNWIISHMLFTVAEETDSIALHADAWHLRTDVYTSAGVMGALSCMWIGTYIIPDVSLLWVDPVAALIVAALIVHAAIKLTMQSARDLMDTTLPEEEAALIRTLIKQMYPRVHGFHKMRTRKAGSDRFIEFHLMVAPEMSVEESHQITEDINRHIVDTLPNSSVTIHVEPCDGSCERHCLESCFLSEKERTAIRHAAKTQRPH